MLFPGPPKGTRCNFWIVNVSQITLVIFLIGLIIGLVMCILFSYNADLAHQHQTLCVVDNCTAQNYTCCKTCGSIVHYECDCTTCTNYLVNLTLDLNGTIYEKVFSSDTCGESMTCYYDDRNVYSTLSLIALEPPSSVISIILFGTFIGIDLVALCILSACWACMVAEDD
jgi:hypothetical protein